MPSKKKKYNARFPAGRIKKIMQSDEEIGKVAQAVPVIISRTLELFVESLLTKTLKITNSRNAKTLSTSHMKQCIMSEQRFDFLRELVKNIPDISVAEEAANYNDDEVQSSPEEQYPDSDTPYDLSMPSTSMQASTRNAMRLPPNGDHFRSHNQNGARPAVSSRHHSEYPTSRAHLKRDFDDMPPRNKNNHCATSSVIMHTAAVAAHLSSSHESSPMKMSRSDSVPANAANVSWSSKSPHGQQRRLKHQTYSLPNSSSSTGPNHFPHTTTTHPKQKQPVDCGAIQQPLLPASHIAHASTTAIIPAPVVSFDFSNKPVVKIDYSNLPLTTTSTAAAAVSTTALATGPLSAPAHLASASSAGFDFSAAPIINIDLTNIVTSSHLSAVHAPAPTATAPPLPPPPQAIATKHSITLSANNNTNKSNSNASTIAAAAAAATTNAPIQNSFLELDEDYDNI